MRQRLLSVDEVAEWLMLPAATIYSHRYRGEKPGALGFRVGRWVRFERRDIEEWIERQK